MSTDGGGPALSVLDLVPVRTGQTSSDALAATVQLARVADRTGYRRYWIAEHHNMPASAGTNPPVLIAMVAAATRSIRVGSGAMLLAHHAPLEVAEQFAMLEAHHPGRIDLGIGRSAGADPETSRSLGVGDRSGASFAQQVRNLAAMMEPAGLPADDGSGRAVRATARATGAPPVWLLGASVSSAEIAGRLGRPYVFGYHLGIGDPTEAIAAYRASFRPSPALAEPRTILPVHAAVAETDDLARAAAMPWLLVMAGLVMGRPQEPVRTVDEVRRTHVPAQVQHVMHRLAERWIIGDPHQARSSIGSLAEAYGVDEVMIHPVEGSNEGADPRRSPGRERTLELVAAGDAARAD